MEVGNRLEHKQGRSDTLFSAERGRVNQEHVRTHSMKCHLILCREAKHITPYTRRHRQTAQNASPHTHVKAYRVATHPPSPHAILIKQQSTPRRNTPITATPCIRHHRPATLSSSKIHIATPSRTRRRRHRGRLR